jgi:F-type H+-transporting ATPase subunit epsilon
VADTFKLSVLTPRTEIFSGVVTTVSVSGDEGEFGVLPGHYAYITAVRPGVLEITEKTETKVYAVGHGFAQVAADKVSIVVSSCEDAASVDAAAERARLADAEQILVDHAPGDDGFAEAELDQALALGRLLAAERAAQG